MADKQDRYRENAKARGYVRVEVLVPGDSANYITAYARALRDADRLGAQIPSFDGMNRPSDLPSVQEPEKLPLSSHPLSDTIPLVRTKATSSADRPANRPDFSGGLFDKK